MTQKEFIEILEEKGYSYKVKKNRIIITHEGYVLLSTSLPENTTFENQGNVYLGNLTSLPENTCFKNQGAVVLGSLTSLPENITFNNKGYIHIRRLTGKHMYQGKWYEFLHVDRFSMIILSRKRVQEYTILKTKYFGGGEISALKSTYIAQKGKYSAHGESIKQAIEDVNFKYLQENFDLDELVQGIKKSAKVTKIDYRLLTGACDAGIEHFKTQNSIDREYLTIEEVIELTKHEFGGDKFRELFT